MTILVASNELKLLFSKGHALGAWSPSNLAHPYDGQNQTAVRNWLVGESVFPRFTVVSTDGSTTTTSRVVNIGSPANGDNSLIVHRTAAASTITGPAGWSQLENVTCQAGDQLYVGTKVCDGTEGATATITHGSAVRSITQAFVITGSASPTYSQYVRDIPLVGSVTPFTDPLLGGIQPGVRRLFMVFSTWDSQGEVISSPASPWIDGGTVSNTGAGGAGQANITYAYRWIVANAIDGVTFTMPDTIAGGANSTNFGMVVSPT